MITVLPMVGSSRISFTRANPSSSGMCTSLMTSGNGSPLERA